MNRAARVKSPVTLILHRVFAGLLSSYSISFTLFPGLLYKGVPITDEQKLKEVHDVARRIGMNKQEIEQLGVYKHNFCGCVGVPGSYAGGLYLVEAITTYLGNEDYSPNLSIGSLSRPHKWQREIFLAHELSHYHLKHGYQTVIVPFLALPIFLGKTLLSLRALWLYLTGLGALHAFLRIRRELQADKLALESLGPHYTQLFILERKIEMEKAGILDKILTYLYHIPDGLRISQATKILAKQ